MNELAAQESAIVRRVEAFRRQARREDGSWPVKLRNPTNHNEIVSDDALAEGEL